MPGTSGGATRRSGGSTSEGSYTLLRGCPRSRFHTGIPTLVGRLCRPVAFAAVAVATAMVVPPATAVAVAVMVLVVVVTLVLIVLGTEVGCGRRAAEVMAVMFVPAIAASEAPYGCRVGCRLRRRLAHRLSLRLRIRSGRRLWRRRRSVMNRGYDSGGRGVTRPCVRLDMRGPVRGADLGKPRVVCPVAAVGRKDPGDHPDGHHLGRDHDHRNADDLRHSRRPDQLANALLWETRHPPVLCRNARCRNPKSESYLKSSRALLAGARAPQCRCQAIGERGVASGNPVCPLVDREE